MPTNDELATLLEEMADLLDAEDVEYKPTAYRRAAENVREHAEPVEELAAEGEDAVAEIDRVGDAIAAKLVEYVETGEIEELEELREELPVDMAALTSVEGVGPKTVGTLYEALGITDLDELEAAARNGEIREVKGFGPKTEQNILGGIDFARQAHQRTLLGKGRPLGEAAREFLVGIEAVEEAELAGSNRRWKETIGDVDVLAASTDGEAVVDAFLDWENSTETIESGPTKASLRTGDGVRVDLRVVDPSEFGAALQYFTGSRDHNIHLRNVAIDRDLKLNEYGCFDVSGVDDPDGSQRVGDRVAGETEEGMYGALDLPPIPPELRENTGEIEAARDGALPDLVAEDEIRGDLHAHTDWSDGDATVEEMALGAAEFGHDYLAITDHAEGPGVFGNMGLAPEEIREQADAIDGARDALAEAGHDLELLHGVETNVDADGGLSTPDDLLAELDVVIASPHAALDQDRGPATDRLVAAIEHPRTDVLGHPTGRMINERAGLSPEFDRLAEAAAENGTALEINANPQRLDLRDSAVRVAVEAGAVVAIGTDAHRPGAFAESRYGVHTARRGWAETDDVLTTRDVDGVRAFLD
ncbi:MULTISPECIES: DNA polymerase/3'-5' exonuclease PolX [Halolamina]|uniref:DNA-directed DNA polymerase n=1 Tax=Halolamina pelagica TaxID=699431 RepID=A0A1I5RYV7_9EURY|nr:MULTISPECIES: DNA polymerase/3'-5' exonuclease PolX [Halolamina]NHX35411.1 DNA polymerase/3'-5' exonuclease PolX [Halolamina sp. R1-12]SFP63640.1 DNA polymerase (family 10) [Halolamina pelagica]